MRINQKCIRCESTESEQWWKCCPRHTTQHGPDVMCEKCALILHPGYAEEEPPAQLKLPGYSERRVNNNGNAGHSQ